MRSQCFRSDSLIILVLIRSQTGTALEDNIIKSRPFSVRGFGATRPKSSAIRVNTVEKVQGPFPMRYIGKKVLDILVVFGVYLGLVFKQLNLILHVSLTHIA